jgi:DNA-binding GntR family transcriptional regulator
MIMSNIAKMSTDSKSISPLPRNIGLRDSITENLLIAILDGSVQAGDRFVIQRLADQLGVSATPVREALIELATLGFVKLLPNRGAVCLEFGPTELREIFQIRRILESEAAFDACGRIPVELVQKLLQKFTKLSISDKPDKLWSEQAIAVDLELHGLIQKYSSNRRLSHEIERYNVLMRSIRYVTGNLSNVQLQAITDHLKIIDALLEEKSELVRRRMNEHLDNTAQGVAKVMFQNRQD